LSRAIRTIPVLAALLLVAAGCGHDGDSKTVKEHADAPARPPARWKTVRNRDAGFTLSVPKSWTARVKAAATLIRSKDKLLVITIAADRGESGRELSPTQYARRTLDSLPDFEGSVRPRARRVRGSPYRSSRVDGLGTLRTSKRAERITVVAYKRPGQVTYALVAFANSKIPSDFFAARLRRILRSFRAQPPRSS
jgi:hypothetical protein